MNQQNQKQVTQVAQNDPILRFAELLIKINKREKVVEVPTEGLDDESSQRNTNNASQAEQRLSRVR